MRAPGMTMEKLPLFVWSVFITAWLLLLSQPVQAGKFCALFSFQKENINLTVCWDILKLGQSAVVDLSQQTLKDIYKFIYSPDSFSCEIFDKEILRDFTSEQTLLYSCESIHIMSICQPSYQTGQYEGDGGYIYVPKKERTAKGKLLNPNIQITFPKKDFPFISIQSTLFYKCSITTKLGRQFYIMTITSKEDIIKVYNQLNGNIKTQNKYDQQNNLYTYLKKDNNYIENIKSINNSKIENNSWLAGFIEANGSFYIRTTKKNNRIRISFEFSICQNKKNFEIMKEISNFLHVNVRDIRKKDKKRVTTTSFDSVERQGCTRVV